MILYLSFLKGFLGKGCTIKGTQMKTFEVSNVRVLVAQHVTSLYKKCTEKPNVNPSLLAEVMTTMTFSMVLHYFYLETCVRAGNLYTAPSRIYQLPFLSGVRHESMWSEHGERSHPNFSHAAGVLVGKWTKT
jgi:hypothetical protein